MNTVHKLTAVVLGLGLLVAVGAVHASASFSWANAEKWAGKYLADKVDAPVQVENHDLTLGAVTGPDLPNPNNVGDLSEQVISQTFKDATTTIISIKSPFLKATTTPNDVVIFTDDAGKKYTSDTTTINFARLNITGSATTSFAVGCAAYSGPTNNAQFTTGIVTTTAFAVPTSTLGMIENNLSAANGGLVDGGTVAKITLTPANPYLLCTVNESVAGGITNPSNTFDGKGVFRFSHTRL